jgi:hypothetical protein
MEQVTIEEITVEANVLLREPVEKSQLCEIRCAASRRQCVR